MTFQHEKTNIQFNRRSSSKLNITKENVFVQKVRDIVKNIPKGKTMTYKEVATKAGNPKAARGVGAIMRSNYNRDIPCHRVVKSDGSLGSYNRGGTLRKKAILKQEGAI